jgi:glyoxylase I family protein
MEKSMLVRQTLARATAAACVFVGIVGCMTHGGTVMTSSSGKRPFVAHPSTAVVRYLVQDLERSITFYTGPLGFELAQQAGPVAIIKRGDLVLLLSDPRSSGARPMPDGRRQEPGGWNRIVLYVDSIDATMSSLRDAGARFRNEVEVGPGGKQVQVEDPDGNPIELHEAPPS